MQLKPQDLRIANKVKRNGIIVDVDHQTFYDLMRYPEQYEAIPITQEWLTKFGFDKRTEDGGAVGFYDYFYIEGYDLNKDIGGWFFINIESKRFKFVHELQNLYFALTNQELKYPS